MNIRTLIVFLSIPLVFGSCENSSKKEVPLQKKPEHRVFTKSSDSKIEKSTTDEKALSLTEQLAQRAEMSAGKTPAEKRKIMVKAIEDLKASQVMKTALKKGDKIPHFKLRDVKKGPVTSQDLLKKGPLVLVFYRGGWCPYCNLQLRDLQSHLKEIKAQGAELVAISPEAPDETASTVQKQELGYYVLSDRYGGVGKAFGLMYELPKDLIGVYEKFGIHLDQTNGNKKWELPLAATYIVNKKGIIEYAFVEADYKLRAETKDIIKKLSGVPGTF